MVCVIGLMGPIASGKSAVSTLLKAHGIPVVDADEIAHELQADPCGQVHKRLVARFGTSILGPEGVVDREKLGAIVFGDREKLRALNSAMHGPILKEIMRQTLSSMLSGHRRVFLDIPLLAHFLATYPRLVRLVLSGGGCDRRSCGRAASEVDAES